MTSDGIGLPASVSEIWPPVSLSASSSEVILVESKCSRSADAASRKACGDLGVTSDEKD